MTQTAVDTFAVSDQRYQVITYRDAYSRWLIVWHQWEGIWEIGHRKPIPNGMDELEALDIVHRFLAGEIDHDDYNQLLPS